jgi:hypothetical protein
MWLDYFPNAEVIGVDIEDFSWFSHPRVRIHRVDQGNRSMLAVLGAKEQPLDIVIDDGSRASRAPASDSRRAVSFSEAGRLVHHRGSG